MRPETESDVAKYTVYNKRVLKAFTDQMASIRRGPPPDPHKKQEHRYLRELIDYLDDAFDIEFCTYRLVASPAHPTNIGKVCAVYVDTKCGHHRNERRIKYLPVLDIGNWKTTKGSQIYRNWDYPSQRWQYSKHRLVDDLERDYRTIDPKELGFYKILPTVYSRSPQIEIDKLKVIIYEDENAGRPKRSKRLRRIADYYNGMARESGQPINTWTSGVEYYQSRYDNLLHHSPSQKKSTIYGVLGRK